MADNTINVKIREAYDTEANWTQKNPVLLQGQIAISSDKHGMYKVGDGTKTWGQLDYASHPASDVYAWAKAETKPSYSSSEISGAVTGVKGAAEASYRTGNVNLTSANIGAVNKSGDTMTGTLVAKGGQFYGSNNASGIDMNNSDIININSIYMADLSDDSREGIHFYRAANTYDSIHAKNGVLYFTPNHAKDNAGTSYPVLYNENGYLEQAMYLNTHPENNPIIIPFIHNDIAYLLERGGSAIVSYDGVAQGVNIAGVFNGSGSYGFIVNPTGITEITIELTLHKQFGWTNTVYIDFGASAWRAKNIKLEVMNQNFEEDTWAQKGSVTGWARGHYFVRFSHTPPGASNAGSGFNKIKLTFSGWGTATIFRIAAIGIYNYSSQGLRETFLPKDGGQMFGNITPFSNSKYDIGDTSHYWKNGYFTNINGAAVGSSPVFTDKHVTQTASDNTNSTVELLLAGNTGNTTETVGARKSAKFYVNPSIGYLYAEGYNRINITGQTLDLNSISFSNGDQSPNIKRYICKTNGGSANISNRPITTQLPFLLDVEAFRINNSTDFYTLQTYRYCPSGDALPEEWQRWCVNGTWKAWKKKEFSDTIYTAATDAPGKIATSSAVGTSLNYARQDHTHGIDLATGDANGQVKIAGSNVSVKGLAALAYKDSIDKADVGLGNVDNKSSETIRGEITSANVTAALGYTPVNKAGDNMSGALYIVNTANDTAGLASALESKSFKFGLHVGTGGANHGIYDFKKSGWVLLGDTQHNWTFNGNASTATTAANVSTQAARTDADRHVWFSDATTETRRNHDDDFKYNPSTNVLTVGQINGSATLTGTPTAPTATAGTNSTQIATTAFVKTAIDNLIDGAPEAYDTLKEISTYITSHGSEYDALLAITNDKQDKITGAATSITQSNLTASRALMSDSSGKIAVSGVSSTELGYLSGVTSSIQTQLDGKSQTQHNHDTVYLKLSGGTLTGVLTAEANQYTDSYSGALNMANSNIYGVNAIYTADAANNATEGIHFYRDSTHVDTLWMNGGDILFVPNRAFGTSTTKANSQKVGRFTANPITGQVVVTDGTTGGMKTTGFTIGKSVPSDAVFTDTTYTFATGDENGQIKVTPSGGTAQNISVKGLGSNAYTSTEFAPIASPEFTGTPTAPTATVGTNNTQIATTAFVNKSVNDVNIGGRNLLKDSHRAISNGDYAIANYYFGDRPPLQDEIVTVQIKGSLAPTKTNWSIYNSGGYVQSEELVLNSDNYDAITGIYTVTGKWNVGTADNTHLRLFVKKSSQSGVSQIEWIKLERGNKATDWTPAPEDVVTTSGNQTIAGVKTFSNDILFQDSGTTTRQIKGTVGANDIWRIAGGATASNAGWLEIATGNEGTEPIYARQYTGDFATIQRTATLLDGSGNTSFPGQMTTGGTIRAVGGQIYAGNSTQSAERRVGVSALAGDMYMYSAGTSDGTRGLWLPAHGTATSGKSIIRVDTNNNVTLSGQLNGNALSATVSSFLNPTNSNTTCGSSTERGTITDGVVVFGESFRNTVDFTNEDESIINDSGDITMWMKQEADNDVRLNMSIDGDYYAHKDQPIAKLSEVVTLTGQQDISGLKTFNAGIYANRGVFCGTYSESAGMYNHSSIEIRENDLVTDEQDTFEYGPKIGFNWSNIVGGTFGLHSDGLFYLRQQNGNDRATLDANIQGHASDDVPITTGFGQRLWQYASSDDNSISGTVARYSNSQATGKPTGSDHALFQMAYDNNWKTQLAQDWRTNKAYIRSCANGTWGDWAEVYTTASKPSASAIGAVAKTGDTMSGNLTVSKAGEIGVSVENTSKSHKVQLLLGNSGNGGLYDNTNGKWIVFSDTSGNGYLNGSPYVASLKGTSGSGRLMLTNEGGIDATDNGYRRLKTIASDIGWHYKPGSQSAGGYAYIQLGNNTNYTTENGTRGFLRLYGNTSYWTDLYAPNSTSNHYIALPNRGGTIFTTEMFSLSGTTLTISTS